MPNPQAGGPGSLCLSLFGTSFKTSPARVTLPATGIASTFPGCHKLPHLAKICLQQGEEKSQDVGISPWIGTDSHQHTSQTCYCFSQLVWEIKVICAWTNMKVGILEYISPHCYYANCRGCCLTSTVLLVHSSSLSSVLTFSNPWCRSSLKPPIWEIGKSHCLFWLLDPVRK